MRVWASPSSLLHSILYTYVSPKNYTSNTFWHSNYCAFIIFFVQKNSFRALKINLGTWQEISINSYRVLIFRFLFVIRSSRCAILADHSDPILYCMEDLALSASVWKCVFQKKYTLSCVSFTLLFSSVRAWLCIAQNCLGNKKSCYSNRFEN